MADDRIFDNEEDDEEELETVDLINEQGEIESYEHLATFPFRDSVFWAVTEAGQDPDAEEMEVLLLEVAQDEEGEDVLRTPDPEVYDAAFDEFLRIAEEEQGK